MGWRSAIAVAFLLCAAQGLAHSQIARQPWYESAIDSTSITISWSTDVPARSTLDYGLTPEYLRGSIDCGDGLTHSITLTHLAPSTAFYVRLRSDAALSQDTVCFISSTASDHRSSGAIEAYFNREIDTLLYPLSPHAHAGADLLSVLEPLIANATSSIDLALYSFSGNTGNTVRSWLRAARDRGVHVRVIADSASIRNSTAWKGLVPDGIPAITNAFGATGGSWSNIHHNKFIIVDARWDTTTSATLMTGSWNLTDQQTTTDYQNVLVIQDRALAKAYEREFDEEWGSSNDMPDSAHSRFSFRKLDNTPRSFNVGGREAHLFFSPNGSVSNALQWEFSHAQASVLFAVYQFTQSALAQSLEGAASLGVGVHGVIGSGGASDQFSALVASGIDVVHFLGYQTLDTLFHHKFAIVDPGLASATVATGSYNWTKSAEELNNENELLLMAPELARDYFSEWSARYYENGGTERIRWPATVASAAPGFELRAWPTPSRGAFRLLWTMYEPGAVRISLFDDLGIRHFDHTNYYSAGPCAFALDPKLSPGVYYVCVQHDRQSSVVRVIITD